MEVILLEKVGKLGVLGDQINVKDGFGRNFLVPRGKAVPANKANKEIFEARRIELENAASEKLVIAQARAKAMHDLSVQIVANASKEGKLFGSIGIKEVTDTLNAAGQTVDKSEIRLPMGTSLRNVGIHTIMVQLHSEVSVSVAVEIVEAK